jgi:hypothetical protein
MKITGITIVRNAILNDYPVVESIMSVLPIVEEMIVSVGDSEDDTENLIRNINSPKIRIVHSTWDMSIRSGGSVLAVETNKVMQHVPDDADWILYVQADELIHEKFHDEIRKAAFKYKDNKKVDGLLFKYLHFYATYDYVGDSRSWYNCETRIIKNDRSITSFRDAQGFRRNGEKIKVVPLNAWVYHYGWVKSPQQMKQKQKNVNRFWNDDSEEYDAYMASDDEFDFSGFDSLKKFEGTHPAPMKERILKQNWKVELNIARKKLDTKDTLLYWIEKLTGKRLFAFRNHTIVKA